MKILIIPGDPLSAELTQREQSKSNMLKRGQEPQKPGSSRHNSKKEMWQYVRELLQM